MDKFFTPNKWFVLFCAAFVAVFITLQMVITSRIDNVAKAIAEDVFSWNWQDRNIKATVANLQVKTLRRGDHDVQVEVSGEQTLSPLKPGKTEAAPETVPCKAVLTLYKKQSYWQLGKVELK